MKILPIIPSIFNFDYELIKKPLQDIIESKMINAIHFDIISDLDKYWDIMQKYNLIADIHLLGSDPIKDLNKLILAKPSFLLRASMHVECGQDKKEFYDLARKNGISPGLAFKLKTPVKTDPGYYYGFDYIHIICNDELSGMKSFQKEVLGKISLLKSILPKNFTIMIDAGVQMNCIEDSARVGVDNVVMGSAIFKSDDPVDTVFRSREILGRFNVLLHNI